MSNLVKDNKEIMKYWDYEKNLKQPSEVGSGGGKSIGGNVHIAIVNGSYQLLI